MMGYATNLAIEARAVRVSGAVHANRMPFSGVLFRVGEAFDVVLSGGSRRRATLCRAGAEATVRSLIAMGVGADPELDAGARGKVGLVTSAAIVGSEVRIEGFVYASDFPGLARTIKTDQADLGFEVQARGTVSSRSIAAAELDALTFTGATLVRRSAAVFWPTSIAASAERRTVSAAAMYALERGGMAVPRSGEKLTEAQIRACLAGIDVPIRRMSIRRTLERERLA